MAWDLPQFPARAKERNNPPTSSVPSFPGERKGKSKGSKHAPATTITTDPNTGVDTPPPTV